jgi:hypothetical protein
MGFKSAAGLAGVALAVAAVWFWRDALAPPRAWLSWRTAPEAPSAAGAGLHKCIDAGRVLYVNGGCPAGSHEQALGGGTVSVVARTPAPTGAAASALPNARDLLLDPRGVEIKDRRIEEIIGK